MVTVPFKTVDGTAKEGEDYIAQNGELKFQDGQTKLVFSLFHL